MSEIFLFCQEKAREKTEYKEKYVYIKTKTGNFSLNMPKEAKCGSQVTQATHTLAFRERMRIARTMRTDIDKVWKEMTRGYLLLKNVVANGNMCCSVDNHAYADDQSHVYVPVNFEAAAVVRDEHAGDQTTSLQFNSGCMVGVGSQSLEQTNHSQHRQRLYLVGKAMERAAGAGAGGNGWGWRSSESATIADFEPVNMVCVVKVDGIKSIDLGGIFEENSRDAEWQPLVFPGLRLERDDVLVRFFDTKKVVCMGLTCPSQIRAIRKVIREMCEKHRGGRIATMPKRYDQRVRRWKDASAKIPMADHIFRID